MIYNKKGLIFLILGSLVTSSIPTVLFGWNFSDFGWWAMVLPMNIGLVALRHKYFDNDNDNDPGRN